jgi:hypothetical protein
MKTYEAKLVGGPADGTTRLVSTINDLDELPLEISVDGTTYARVGYATGVPFKYENPEYHVVESSLR